MDMTGLNVAHDESVAPLVGVVVLTQGARPDELAAALASVRAQLGVRTDVVVVGNGWRPHDLPGSVRRVELPENVGIPAGRNAGVGAVGGEFVLFLDDDARLGSATFLLEVLAKFADDPELGLVQPRVEASDGEPPGRWIPRLRKGDPRRSSPAFSCWEGAVVVRRAAFVQVGEWPAQFFYAHEGIDLAFRLWDSGHRVLYAGDVPAVHPAVNPTRHAEYHYNNARNRVWIARRNLRWPLSWIYVLSWTVVQVLRSARPDEVRTLRHWFAGWRAGWCTDPGPRRRMKWSTVWRLTRLGRPPII